MVIVPNTLAKPCSRTRDGPHLTGPTISLPQAADRFPRLAGLVEKLT
jgi:hypothetical protein